MEKSPEKNVKIKRGKIKRILLILFSGIVVLFALVLTLAPGITKNYINRNGQELVGRSVQIDKIKLNYFTSTLKVYGAKLYEKNSLDVFMGFDTLMLNLKPLRLLKHEIFVQQFHIVNSHAQIVQNDTIYNFSDLLEFFASENTSSAEEVDTSSSIQYKLNLNLIEIRNGSLSFEDQKMEHSVALEELSFTIPHIYWGSEEKSNADISFKLGRGGSFSSSLDYDSKNGYFSGNANLSKLELEAFLPYLKEFIRFSDADGTLSSELNFDGIQSDLEQLRVQGSARIENLKIRDEQDKEVLGLVSASGVLKEFRPLQYYAEVDLIQIDQPYVYFALIDSMSNFERMLVEQIGETDKTTKSENEINEEEIPKQVVLNRFVINDGLVDFSDQRLREEFLYELSEVSIDMDTIEFQDNWVNINAEMKLNKRGKLDAQIGLNPSAILDSIQLDYVLTDFQLPDVNIYSKHYVGLPILFGEMYYVSKTSIVNKQLNSENELIIRNVEMGRKGGGLYDIPIKLALFILKDINGDITLDVPVSGDLSDPKTRIGPIVWDTFKGFMVKIVASPFKALGNLLGADPDEIEQIAFDYADTTLVRKQIKSLDLLLELEQLKPELQIDLHYLNDKTLEKKDVAREISHQLYFEEKNQKASSHTKDYMEFLALTTGQDSLLIQDYEMLLAPPAKVDSLLEFRESLRITKIKDYLSEKNDSTGIRLFDYNEEEVLNIGSRPRFEVRYLLAEEAQE